MFVDLLSHDNSIKYRTETFLPVTTDSHLMLAINRGIILQPTFDNCLHFPPPSRYFYRTALLRHRNCFQRFVVSVVLISE